MDVVFAKDRSRYYYLSLANAEANALFNTATHVSAAHLHDSLIRTRFQNDVKGFIQSQLNFIRSSNDDKQCQVCIQAIRQERDSLLIQDRMLRTGEAVLTAAIRFYHEHDKVIGYVIDGIGIVIGGIKVIGGLSLAITSAGTMNVVGILAGCTLVFHGASAVLAGIDKVSGVKYPQNIAQNTYESAAVFLGFDRKIGSLAYQGVDMAASMYGLFKPIFKDNSWRLFNWMPKDFYHKINTLTPSALTIEAGKAGYKMYAIGNTYMSENNQ